MREQGAPDNDLLDRLAADDRLPLDRAELDAMIGEPLTFVGIAVDQVDAFVTQVAEVVARHPEAAVYRPEPIL
jgi:adenylosuccinate lyase